MNLNTKGITLNPNISNIIDVGAASHDVALSNQSFLKIRCDPPKKSG